MMKGLILNNTLGNTFTAVPLGISAEELAADGNLREDNNANSNNNVDTTATTTDELPSSEQLTADENQSDSPDIPAASAISEEINPPAAPAAPTAPVARIASEELTDSGRQTGRRSRSYITRHSNPRQNNNEARRRRRIRRIRRRITPGNRSSSSDNNTVIPNSPVSRHLVEMGELVDEPNTTTTGQANSHNRPSRTLTLNVPSEVLDEPEALWRFAEATAIDPEMVLYATPAESDNNDRWFRDAFVKTGVVGVICCLLTLIIALSGALLLISTQFVDSSIDPNIRGPVYPEVAEDYIFTHIVSPVSTIEDLDKVDSPQYNAFKFITINGTVTHDVINSDYSCHGTIQFPDDKCLLERYIMAVIYFSLGGSMWHSSNNWLSLDSHVCTWDHVLCRNSAVTSIFLDYENLAGEIPKEFAHLTSLYKLYMRGNNIIGSIPESIGEMSNLTVLHLGNNRITGAVPESIYDLKSLRVLDLASNNMHGQIHPNIGELQHLEHLDISHNSISGIIPETLGLSYELVLLYLDFNLIEGTIPMSLASLENLKFLDISNTNLSGDVPSDICDRESSIQVDIRVDCEEVVCNCCDECNHSNF